MVDDFRISELVTLATGFAREALRAAARGQTSWNETIGLDFY